MLEGVIPRNTWMRETKLGKIVVSDIKCYSNIKNIATSLQIENCEIYMYS